MSTQEKPPVDKDGSAWGLTINGYGVFSENDIAQIQALIDTATREAIDRAVLEAYGERCDKELFRVKDKD